MSNIATKLTYLNGTKQAIKQAINEDFEVIDNNTTFREYADEISSNNAKYKDLIPKETKNATNTLDISNSAGLDKALVTQYGNTYQEGEPTPDTPQEIVNISDKSTLKDVGKNLFDKNNYNYIQAYISSDGVIISNASNYSIYIPCNANTTYTISRTQPATGNNKFGIAYTNAIPTANMRSDGYLRNNNADNLTITTGANAKYLLVWCWVADYDITLDQMLSTIQIEKNSTASEYEPYQEQSFDLDLKSKNLFKTPYNESSITKNGITFTINEDGSIHVEGTATAKTQFNLRNRDLLLDLNIGERYTMATSGLGAVDSTIWLDTYGQTGNFLGKWVLTSSTPYASAVAEAKDNKPLISITVENGATINTDVKVWLYKGAYDNSIEYTQYKTPIELCKTIEDYKDRIYPLNGKWYLEKNIGKVTITGNDITAINTNQTNTTRAKTGNNFISTNQEGVGYSNYFQIVSNWGTDAIGLYYSKTNGDVWFRANKTLIGTTLESVQTWVNSHNVTLYYVLATPTTTEITESNYPTLYEQLNNIKLYEGVNHLTFTNESGLDVEFDIEYYKDWKLD